MRVWAVGLAGGILVLAWVAPLVLHPFNRAWTQFGFLLHKLVSPVALGVLFFGVVTPTGLLLRLFGKDPLCRKLDPNADSYWVKRVEQRPSPDSLRNQF